MSARIGRNEPCICGSGKKFKKCCLAADEPPQISVAEDGGLSVRPAWIRCIEDTGRGHLSSRPFRTESGILTTYTDESGNTGIYGDPVAEVVTQGLGNPPAARVEDET